MLGSYWLAFLSRQACPKVEPNRHHPTRRSAAREVFEAVSSTAVGPSESTSASPSRESLINNVSRVLLISLHGNVTTRGCVGSKQTRDLGMIVRPTRLAILTLWPYRFVQGGKSSNLLMPCSLRIDYPQWTGIKLGRKAKQRGQTNRITAAAPQCTCTRETMIKFVGTLIDSHVTHHEVRCRADAPFLIPCRLRCELIAHWHIPLPCWQSRL